MRLKRLLLENGEASVAVRYADAWYPLAPFEAELGRAARDLLAFLAGGAALRERTAELLDRAHEEGRPPEPVRTDALLPFEPTSFRDFMLYEAHAVGATKGWLKRFMPRAYRFVQLYERIAGRPHGKVRPSALWYQRPIHYLGNPRAFLTENAEVPWPGYTRALDYELELGFVLARPLRDAGPEEALAAIGGFFVVNDYSARDVQAAEMRSGFGPVKAKNFATGMAAEVVTPDEVLPDWQRLGGRVRLDGEIVCEGSAAGPRFDLGEAVAYASLGEPLEVGAVLATGTFPGCSALESERWPEPGQEVTAEIDGVGRLTQRLGRPPG
ncbi:fumarylacetoacetate hydrolase family protein [Oceanithermus sp.]|uniref:fumarylacetoacetate hydrolase family protein n=1 Tax=Oceanithermus sp. TaxID=2268145 RepID=UPI0025CC5972|nr:fumarylacetoacetate hydrolase family protein [Oceanithermus sp.]